MRTVRKSIVGLVLGVVLATVWMGGDTIFKNVQFARAEQQVEATRAQIANVQDMAAVFKSVNKVVEPAVVEIEVTRMTPVSNSNSFRFRGMSPNQLRQWFPDRDGDGQPDIPDGLFQFDTPQNQVPEQGTGSGVIMEVDGKTAYLVTNNHVAGEAGKMVITLWDDRKITNATVVGTDPKSDIAVVKIEADHLIPAKWGDSDSIEKGDIVMAFGAPFGYVGSMTHGIISALNRRPGIIASHTQFAYENFIQVDAPINPGNSGGPLVDLKGEVIGINTAIATESGGFQGLGFAIPSNQAKYIFDTIKTKGRVVRGWLGVAIADVNEEPEKVQALGYTDTKGALIDQVIKNSPAAGKLDADDIITAVNGKKVDNSQELRNLIASTVPDTDVKIDLFRDGKQQEVTLKLKEQPDDMNAVATAPDAAKKGDAQVDALTLGMKVTNASSDLLQRYEVDPTVHGVMVTAVRPNSLADRANLTVGDVITRIDNVTVSSTDELNAALGHANLDRGIRVYVSDKQGTRSVFVRKGQE